MDAFIEDFFVFLCICGIDIENQNFGDTSMTKDACERHNS